MRIQTRLRHLERCVDADRVREDSEEVEIWLPDSGRGGLPPGRYPCEGTQTVLIIYEPSTTPPLGEAPPWRCTRTGILRGHDPMRSLAGV
jgi:hypothetical protein